MKPIYIYLFTICALYISCNNVEKKEYKTPTKNENLDSLIKQSNYLYQTNEYSKAISIFNKIIAIDTTKGEMFYRRAYCKAQLFDYSSSNMDYQKAIDLKYRIEDSYFNLGCNFAATSNDTLALKFFQKAYEINPKNESAKAEISFFKKRIEAKLLKNYVQRIIL